MLSSTTIHHQSSPQSNYLVIINKGPGALKIKREGLGWDLMEIFFMEDDIQSVKQNPDFTDADHIIFETNRNMRKFSIIKRVFELEASFRSYEYILMLDDDLVPVRCSIKDIFNCFVATGARVGQPALTKSSYWTHKLLLQDKSFSWRWTNFVEVMCPIFSNDALNDYLPIFDSTISGFGLDVFWSLKEWRNYGGLVVLDSTPLRHCRPVRGGIAYQGLAQAEEKISFFEAHKLKDFGHLTLGGKLSKCGTNIGRPDMFVNKVSVCRNFILAKHN